MRMKKGLLMVLLLLAVSSVMASMSFSSASVSNDLTVSLVDTEDALLALDASEVHAAATVDHITANQLKINLDRGNGGDTFGVQANSVYTWDDLFKVTNNSEHPVDVSISIPNTTSRININASVDGTSWTNLVSHARPSGGTLTFSLEPGESQWIDIQARSLNGWETTLNPKLLVEAVAK